MESPARVVVWLEGGLVQWTFADRPVEILIVDQDIEGADEDRLTVVEGDEVCVREDEVQVDPERVARMWKEAGR